MSIACEFEYVRPASLKDALRLLARPPEGGAMPLAGGSDLIAWLRDGAVQPGLVVDIKQLPELRGIRVSGGGLWMGAAVPFSELMESPAVQKHAPVLVEAAGVLASVGIRNRATPAGNICSAVPCCDSGPVLLVYEAEIHVATLRGTKVIPAANWFLAPRRTALPPGGLVTGIRIPVARHAGAFAKLKRYRGEDLAQASVAVRVDAKGAWRVAFGSVAPTPIRGRKTEKILAGHKQPEGAVLEQAATAAEAEVAPITDIRSSEHYRRLMVGVMLRRSILLASARLVGKGAAYGINIIEEDAP
ncbi:MAG: xanthine dehydrogenase family protein subunit M [Verrucomicrobiota bacterium]|jgi:CO/xanthine dehydrogenase FAD-binding subunit|nr:xanthine dehydrogenase family protein subunit M [Verrucomicrobiota bacterium]